MERLRTGSFAGNLRRILLLFAALIGTEAATAEPGGGEAPWSFPSSRLWYQHPATEFLFAGQPNRYSTALPVGVLGLFRPVADPTLFSRNRPQFLDEFDLLSSVSQLKYINWYLLDLPKSPGIINVLIQKGAASVDNGYGEPLGFMSVSGSGGISRPESLLLPPPIIGFRAQAGPFVFRTGVFAGVEGYALGPDKALQTAIDTTAIAPDSRYGLFASAAASAGVCEGITWLFHRPLGSTNVRLILAPRLYLYSILAHFDGRLDAHFTTNSDGIPESWGYSWRARYTYPGKGMGIGLRTDLGVMLLFERLLLTGTLLDIAGLKYVPVTAIGEDSTTLEKVFDYLPSPSFLAMWRLPVDRVDAILSVEGRYIGSFGGSAGVRVFADPVGIAATFRYQDAPQLEFRSYIRIKKIRLEGGLLFVNEPISKRNLIGFGVGLEITGES